MNLVENSFYDHEKYGRVQLIKIEDDEVVIKLEEETTHVPGIGRLKTCKRDDRKDFERKAEPADVDVSMPSAKKESGAEAPGA